MELRGNKEIKFRAWDKKSKKMRAVDSIGFGAISNYESGYPVVMLLGTDIIEQKDILLHREGIQFELMQYTGLKDKNGVCIYEKDIVVYKNSEEQGVFYVTFENCGFFAKWIESETFIDKETSLMYLQCSKELEVIGNIYENPKLFKRR